MWKVSSHHAEMLDNMTGWRRRNKCKENIKINPTVSGVQHGFKDTAKYLTHVNTALASVSVIFEVSAPKVKGNYEARRLGYSIPLAG
jgi:hypothetical protein